MNTPHDFDIAAIRAIARQAGAEIMALRPSVIANPEIKGDGSPVTLADKRSSDIVINGLGALTPDIPVISEERAKDENLAIQQSCDKYWIVDPLDGTRSYIDGYDGFGVHIGLIDNGNPVVGVIYFPAQDEFYFTDKDGKAYWQHADNAPRPIRVNAPADVSNPPKAAVSWKEHRRPEGFAHVTAVGGARVCITAEGQTDIAMIESPFSYWDIAAAHAVLRAAGGELYELDSGQAVRYPADKLSIARSIGGHPDVAKTLRPQALAAADIMLMQNRAKAATSRSPKPG